MSANFDIAYSEQAINRDVNEIVDQQKLYYQTHAEVKSPALKYFDLLHMMTAEQLADFFYGSPTEEFGICDYCDNFGGAGNPEPCSSIYCDISCKNKAFKKFLHTDVPENVTLETILPADIIDITIKENIDADLY